MNEAKVEKLKQRLSSGGPISLRPNEDDQELLVKLYMKKRMEIAVLYRLGLRALAEAEKLIPKQGAA